MTLSVGVSAGDESDDAIEGRIADLRRWAAEGARREPEILECLRSEFAEIRIEAGVVLLGFNPTDARAWNALRRELRSENAELAERAAVTIAATGETGLRVLVTTVQEGTTREASLVGIASVESIPLKTLEALAPTIVAVLDKSENGREIAWSLELAGRDEQTAKFCAVSALRHLDDTAHALDVLRVLDAAGGDRRYIGPLSRVIERDGAAFQGGNGFGFEEYELASSLLCRCGPEGVATVLSRVAVMPDERLLEALRLGVQRHMDTTFDALLAATRSREPQLRARAVGFLAAVYDEDKQIRIGIALATAALQDEDRLVRKRAALELPNAVARTRQLPMDEAMHAALRGHPDEAVRIGVLRSMRSAGEVPVPELLLLLDDLSEKVRLEAVVALGHAGQPASGAVDRILALIRSGDDRRPCYAALMRIAPKDPRVVDVLTRELAVTEQPAAALVIRALARGEVNAPGAERWLRMLIMNDDSAARLWRRCALWQTSGSESDLEALLLDLEESLQAIGDLWGAEDIAEILTVLGPAAERLAPIVDAAARCVSLSSWQREKLLAARRALGE